MTRRADKMISASAISSSFAAGESVTRLSFATAGQGSAFLPYGEGLAKVAERSGAIRLDVRQSGGSIENLLLVNGSSTTIATAFLGTVHEAVTGTGFADGRRLENLRALFPMYETAFMMAALRSSGLNSLEQLDGRRVGAGPAHGPAEGYLRAAAEFAQIRPVIVSGTPADLARQVMAGTIDALWQGAVVPVPSLVEVANGSDAVLFGLSPQQVKAMRARFAFMSPVTVAAGTYRGQTAPLESVAAWNFVVAHKDMPDAVAEALTRTILSAQDLVSVVGASASGTRAMNAGANSVVPFHPGALKLLRDVL